VLVEKVRVNLKSELEDQQDPSYGGRSQKRQSAIWCHYHGDSEHRNGWRRIRHHQQEETHG